MSGPTHWHLLSGEYPPKLGGVADYTRQVASALAARGDAVHVWAPRTGGREQADPGIEVHRVDDLGPGGLRQIGDALASFPRPRRWFVQYVPTGLGLRGMNVPLIRWLRALPDEVWVQFHEVALGWQLWRKPHHHVMHAVQLWMAAALAQRADRIFISVEGWRPQLGRQGKWAIWLPIPSNVPVRVTQAEQAAVRNELGQGPWVAHFGTYGAGILRDLLPASRQVAREREEVRFLFLGRGAERAAQALPVGRVVIGDGLPAEAVATRLSIATLALQPFPDGISARRTSAMAAVGLGVPVVTTEGHLTDAIWRSGEAVALAPVGHPQRLAEVCLELLDDPGRRKRIGERAAALYAERFSLDRTCSVLCG
jgi:glycosyltransferase involved in cell wall biosynthesis